jgi:hypothetical protein
MLVCLKVYMEWPKTRTSWNLKNYGFSIYTSSTIGWTSWNGVVAIATHSIRNYKFSRYNRFNLNVVNYLIQVGFKFFFMPPCMAIASSFSPPIPLISSEQVRFSSSSKSLTSYLKVVLDFFFGGEVTCSRLNVSLGVGGFVFIFNRWDWHVGKGDVVVKCAGLFFFKNCSLVIGSGETCCCCATWRSWVVGDTSFFWVVIISERILDKGNHFLNKMFKIDLKEYVFVLVLLETKLAVAFFNIQSNELVQPIIGLTL